MPSLSDAARLALDLAACGWHIHPLAASRRPFGNCPSCQPRPGTGSHHPDVCPCLAAGKWCHGVRAATTDPARITAWWQRAPRAVPGVAAGPSGLVLVDIDAHGDQLPASLATGLLPGIDLASEPVPASAWNDPSRYRDGRDALTLLARLRGGSRPWPADTAHQPVTVATPSGGRHLWYQAPASGLRQVLSDSLGRYGLAWQVDIKAGWSYGIAPGASTTAGIYQISGGNRAAPGQMPIWLASEITRVTATWPSAPRLPAPPRLDRGEPGAAAYLTTIIDRGAAHLATMTDGRQRALSKLAYHAGGLLDWSGLTHDHVATQLINAGTASGLAAATATRVVHRAMTNGISRPVASPRSHR